MSCSARTLIRAPKKRLSVIISIRPPSSGGNGRMLTTARLADRMPATYSVKIGPSCQKMSPIWVGDPDRPWTGGASVGRLTIESAELPEPADDQAERVDRPLRADPDRLAGAVVER